MFFAYLENDLLSTYFPIENLSKIRADIHILLIMPYLKRMLFSFVYFSAQGFTIFAVLASIMYAGHNQQQPSDTSSKTQR